MEAYTIYTKEGNENKFIATYTDREVALKMMRVYKRCSPQAHIYCHQAVVTNTIPAWAERILNDNAKPF